jgi:hypothetical protein
LNVDGNFAAMAFIRANDLASYRSLCTRLLKRAETGPSAAGIDNHIAWLCALAPEAVADLSIPVRVAEAALAAASDDSEEKFNQPKVLNTLGATLYRAGRFEEAIRRLNERRLFWKSCGQLNALWRPKGPCFSGPDRLPSGPETCHDTRMSTTRRLLDVYRFPGFEP